MPLIRTTFNPSAEMFVDDREYLDLSRQGLIYSGDTPLPPTPLALRIRLVDLDGSPDEHGAQIESEEVI